MLTKYSKGVTIPELVVVISVIGILTGLLFGPFDDLYQSNSKGLQSIIQTTDTRGALRQIEREITTSSAFLTTSTTGTSDINGNTPYVSTAWTSNGTATPTIDTPKQVLITETNAVNSSGGLVMADSNCTTQLKINYVYFVKGGTLYRRVLKKIPTPAAYTPAGSGCVSSAIAQKRTCAVSFSSANCEARDVQIVSSVSNFSVGYLSSSVSSQNPSSDPTSAKTVVISLETTDKNGQKAAASMRITRMNGS